MKVLKNMSNTDVLQILERTLNYTDPRLINHGKRVSYILYQLLKDNDKYTKKQLRDLLILAMIHDIGAYKTEEIDQMVRFETEEIWDHSIFGYLFLREFSPLRNISPLLLLHHADCISIQCSHESYHELSQLLNISDRMDVFYQTGTPNYNIFLKYLESNRDVKFMSQAIDTFMDRCPQYPDEETMDDDFEFIELINETPFTSDEINRYFWMIVLSIDFRSSHTVTHTLMTANISKTISEMMDMSEDEIEIIRIASLLHDIGKSGIPIEILESPGKLTKHEMNTMRKHVNMTDYILSGSIDSRIRDIAVRHHEKLNGSGYPKRLSEEDLSRSECIVAVADILSALCAKRSYKDAYPKEKTLKILYDMCESGELNSEVVDLVSQKYDEIMDNISDDIDKTTGNYNKISIEFKELREDIEDYHDLIISEPLDM